MTKYEDELRDKDHKPLLDVSFVFKWVFKKIFGIHDRPSLPPTPHPTCSVCKKDTKVFTAIIDPAAIYLDTDNVLLLCSECASRIRWGEKSPFIQ